MKLGIGIFSGVFDTSKHIKIGTRIVAWVLGPLTLLGIAATVYLLLAAERAQQDQEIQREFRQVAQNLATTSNEMSAILLSSYEAISNLREARRRTLSDQSNTDADLALRKELSSQVRRYIGETVRFTSLVQTLEIDNDETTALVTGVSSAALHADRLMSLYIVSHSRTQRLLALDRQDAVQLAQNNFRFEELQLLDSVKESLARAASVYAKSSAVLLDYQASRQGAVLTEREKLEKTLQIWSICILVLAIVTVGTASFFEVQRTIISPIRAIPDLVKNSGKQRQEEEAVGNSFANRKDEIGDVITAVEDFGQRITDERAAEEQQKRKAEEETREERRRLRQEQDEKEQKRKEQEEDAKLHAEQEERARNAGEQAAAQVRMEEQVAVVDALGRGLLQLADGKLTASITAVMPREYEELREHFNRALSDLSATMSGVSEVADFIRSEVSQIVAASEGQSKRALHQANALQESAMSVNELTQSTSSLATRAEEIRTEASGMNEKAEKSLLLVAQSYEAMEEIKTSSIKISSITNLLSDISFQTNLLALNAGVEAARAGEHGRGFAVVASEVRALAQRASDAADEINGLIVESSAQVEKGHKLVGGVSADIKEVTESFDVVARKVADMSVSLSEQSKGIGNINTSLGELEGNTQKSAAISEELAATAQCLDGQCRTLDSEIGKFDFSQETRILNSDTKLAG